MVSSTPDLQLTGGTVTIITPGAHEVAQGMFRLENRDGGQLLGTFDTAWLEFERGRQVLLPEVIVYELSRGLPLDPQRFTIGAQASLPIEIDFVEPAYEPDFGECTAVGLRLEVGGVVLEALSPVEFVHAANGRC